MDLSRPFLLSSVLLFVLMCNTQPVTSAPLSWNDTAPVGCYHMMQHYSEGDQIITDEPCLNCTCSNSMLMCFLKVCPYVRPLNKGCVVRKEPGDCCPTVTCDHVPVPIMQMMGGGLGGSVLPLEQTTSSEATVTVLPEAITDGQPGCQVDGQYFPDGAQVPNDPAEPCDVCYCIRNQSACVQQECTMLVPGCRPVFQPGVCCPVRYDCQSAGLVTSPPTTTSTTPEPETTAATCSHNGTIYNDGDPVPAEDPCSRCYCMHGGLACVLHSCPSPLHEVHPNCTPVPPGPGQCCPQHYNCDSNGTLESSVGHTGTMGMISVGGSGETLESASQVTENSDQDSAEDKNDLEESKATESTTIDIGGIDSSDDDDEESEAHVDEEHDEDEDSNKGDGDSDQGEDDDVEEEEDGVETASNTSEDDESSTEQVTASPDLSTTSSSIIISPTEHVETSSATEVSSENNAQSISSSETSNPSSEASSLATSSYTDTTSEASPAATTSVESASHTDVPVESTAPPDVPLQSTESLPLTGGSDSSTVSEVGESTASGTVPTDLHETLGVISQELTSTTIGVDSTANPAVDEDDFESGSGLDVISGDLQGSGEISGDGEDGLMSATDSPTLQGQESGESIDMIDSTSASTELSGDLEEDQFQEIPEVVTDNPIDHESSQSVPTSSISPIPGSTASFTDTSSEQSVVQESSDGSPDSSIESSGSPAGELDTGDEGSGEELTEDASEITEELPVTAGDLSGNELDELELVDPASTTEIQHSTEILPIEEAKPTATTTELSPDTSTESSTTSKPKLTPTISAEQISSIVSGSITADIHSDGDSDQVEPESSGDSGDSFEAQILELVDEVSGNGSSEPDSQIVEELSGDITTTERTEADIETENNEIASTTQNSGTITASLSSEAASTPMATYQTTESDIESSQSTNAAEIGTEGFETTIPQVSESTGSITNESQPISSSTVQTATEIVDEVIDMAQTEKPTEIEENITTDSVLIDGLDESSGQGEGSDVSIVDANSEESSGEIDIDLEATEKPDQSTVTEITFGTSSMPETVDQIADGESESSGFESETEINLLPDADSSVNPTDVSTDDILESNGDNESSLSLGSTETTITSSSQTSAASTGIESENIGGDISPAIEDDGEGSGFPEDNEVSQEVSSDMPPVPQESGSEQTDSSSPETVPIEQIGGPTTTGSIIVENSGDTDSSTDKVTEESSTEQPAEINGPSETIEEISEEESSGFVSVGTEIPEADISEVPDTELSTEEQIDGSASGSTDYSGDEVDNEVSSEGFLSSTIDPQEMTSSGDYVDTDVENNSMIIGETEDSSTFPSVDSSSMPSIIGSSSTEDDLSIGTTITQEGSGDDNLIKPDTEYSSTTSEPVTETASVDNSQSVDEGKDNSGGVSTISNQTAQTLVDVLGAMLGATESSEQETSTADVISDGGVELEAGVDCLVGGGMYRNGSSVPSADRCQLECLCLDGAVMCQQVECSTAPASPACRPVYSNNSCCPQYECPNQTASQCTMDGNVYSNGDVVQYPDPCSYCLCIDGEIICASQMCHPPRQLVGLNCKPLQPEQAQCCSTRFHCDVTALEVLGFGKDNRTQGDVMFLGEEAGESISVLPSALVTESGSEEQDKADGEDHSTPSQAITEASSTTQSSADSDGASTTISTSSGDNTDTDQSENVGETSTEITTITMPTESVTVLPELTSTSPHTSIDTSNDRSVQTKWTITAVKSVLVPTVGGTMVVTYTTVTVIEQSIDDLGQPVISKQSTMFKSRRPAATDDLVNMPDQTPTVSTVVDKVTTDSNGQEHRETSRINGVPSQLAALVNDEGQLIVNQNSTDQYLPGNTIITTTQVKVVVTIRPSDNMADRYGTLYNTTVTTVTNNVTDINGKSTVTQQQTVSTAKRAANQYEAELFRNPQKPMITTVVETTRVNSDGTLTTTISRDDTAPAVESQISEGAPEQSVTESTAHSGSAATASSTSQEELESSTAPEEITSQPEESSSTLESKPESSTPTNIEPNTSSVESIGMEESATTTSSVDLESSTSPEQANNGHHTTSAVASSTEGLEIATEVESGSHTEIGSTASSSAEGSNTEIGSTAGSSAEGSNAEIGSTAGSSAEESDTEIESTAGSSAEGSNAEIGSTAGSSVEGSNAEIGSTAGSSVEESDTEIESTADSSVEESDTEIESTAGSSAEESNTEIGSTAGSSAEESNTEIGSTAGSSVEGSDTESGSTTGSSVEGSDTEIGSTAGSSAEESNTEIGSTAGSSVEGSDTEIGSTAGSSVEGSDTEIGSTAGSSVEGSDTEIGSTAGSSAEESNTEIGSTAGSSVEGSDTEIGSTAGSSVEGSDTEIGSTAGSSAEESNTEIGSTAGSSVEGSDTEIESTAGSSAEESNTEIGSTAGSSAEESYSTTTEDTSHETTNIGDSAEEASGSVPTDDLMPGTSRIETTITTVEEALSDGLTVQRVSTVTKITDITDSNGVITSTTSETTVEESEHPISDADRYEYANGPRASTNVVTVTTNVDEDGHVTSKTVSGGVIPDRLMQIHPASDAYSQSDQIYLPGSRVETTTYTTQTEKLQQVDGATVVHILLNTTSVSVESSSDGRQTERKRTILRRGVRKVNSSDNTELDRFSDGPVVTTDVKVEVFEVDQNGVVTSTINGVQQNDTDDSSGGDSEEQSAMISVTNEVMEMLNEGVEQFANTTDISDAEVEGGASAEVGTGAHSTEETDQSATHSNTSSSSSSTATTSTTTSAVSQHVFLGPGACLFDGRVYVSAQQIPRDNPCDFCFCFRGDIICLQQSCPQPSPSCESHQLPETSPVNGSCCVAQNIEGFCCPRYVCTKETSSLTVRTAPPHSIADSHGDIQQYNDAAPAGESATRLSAESDESSGCDIQGQHYQPGQIVEAASGPCLECRCGDDGMMACNPQRCQPQPILKKMMIAAAQRRRR